MRQAQESAVYIEGQADERAKVLTRATLKEAERRVKGFDRAMNTTNSHEAFQACLLILRELREAL